MSQAEFDIETIFDDDYLHFYADRLADERSDAEAEAIWHLLDLKPGLRVLDLACGHGRIANRLAARGCQVTGLDATPLFLDLARREAAARGVAVEYVSGDMRELPWRHEFDRVVNWFTAFGYFDDDGNREVLRQIHRVLRPGGRLVLDLQNRDRLLGALHPDRVIDLGDDLMIDRSTMNLPTGRLDTERIILRGGRQRRTRYSIRLFTLTELRDWLVAADFTNINGYGDGSDPLTLASIRMRVTADTPAHGG